MFDEYLEKILESGWSPENSLYTGIVDGRSGWRPQRQPDFPRGTAWDLLQMVTHQCLNPIQQGLTLGNSAIEKKWRTPSACEATHLIENDGRRGRCNSWPLRQVNSSRCAAWGFLPEVVTHPVLKPVQQGLTSINRWRSVNPSDRPVCKLPNWESCSWPNSVLILEEQIELARNRSQFDSTDALVDPVGHLWQMVSASS